MKWQTDSESDVGVYPVKVRAVNVYGEIVATVNFEVIVQPSSQL